MEDRFSRISFFMMCNCEKENELFLSVNNDDLKKIRSLLKDGADVNMRNANKDTLLHRAVAHGNLIILKELLLNGADPNAKNKYGKTPIHIALGSTDHDRRLGMITALVDAGATVNSKDRNVQNFMFSGVRNDKDFAAWQVLETAGATLDVFCKRSIDQKTLLHAAYNGELSARLIASGADVNAKDIHQKTPLHYAVEDNKGIDVISILLNHGADVDVMDSSCFTPLYHAVCQVDLDAVNLLIGYGADINHRFPRGYFCNQTPLEKAVEISIACAKQMIKTSILQRRSLEDYQNVINLNENGPSHYYDMLHEYLEQCVCEIIRMKTEIICGTFPLYSFLLKIRQKVKPLYIDISALEGIINNYPIYKDLIIMGVEYSSKRAALLESLKEASVPYLDNAYARMEIAEYLNNEDLCNFVEAFKGRKR